MALAVPALRTLDQVEAQLTWLDGILERAVVRQRAEGRWRGEDDLRGVYTSPELAAAVLAGRAVDAPEPLASVGAGDGGPLTTLWQRFALGHFERFALLLALAPELDARYRTVFGYLNDDVAQGTPTVAMALDLYAGPGPRSAALRRAFRAHSPLVRYRLLWLQPAARSRSLLRHGLEVDDWVVARAVDDDAPGSEDWRVRVERPGADTPPRWRKPKSRSSPVIVACADRRAALDETLALAGRPLIVVERDRDDDPEHALTIAARRARLDGLGLAISATSAADPLCELARGFAADGVPIFITAEPGDADALPDDWERVRLPAVDTAQRRARWASALDTAGVAFAQDALDVVAASHPIALERIDAAVTRVAGAPGDGPRTGAELQAAARAVARHQLGSLARRIPDGRRWTDLVLPARTIQQLREIAAAIEQRPHVLHEWGFGARAGGRGMHVLFSGPSGTGKTLAASVIADEAGYALYAVDLARVVDKYLGETEKQLDRVFDEASAAGAVLLFDEADALFGQRAEVHDARDRYANVEIAYLLQRLEAHEGVTILATNLAHHLDQAFARRLHHRVEFPMPDGALRERLWRVVIPAAVPLASDLDLGLVAERFELSGGSIRNAALTAAYLAASDQRAIGLSDVVRAIARELEKAGRPATRAEFRELHGMLVTTGKP